MTYPLPEGGSVLELIVLFATLAHRFVPAGCGLAVALVCAFVAIVSNQKIADIRCMNLDLTKDQ